MCIGTLAKIVAATSYSYILSGIHRLMLAAMPRTVIRIILKILSCLLTALFAFYYLKLGWFYPIIVILCFIVTFVITKKERRDISPHWLGPVIVAVFFALIAYAIVELLLLQSSEVTTSMRWSIEYATPDHQAPEVLLWYPAYPGYYSRIQSAQLATYLEQLGASEIQVKTLYLSTLWCPRGFQHVQIGELQKWDSSGGSSGYQGSDSRPPSPHPEPGWWCS